MKIIVEQKLRYLFRDDLFFCQEPFHSENEAIDFLAGQLEEKGMVSSEFKQLILERESISPSSYGKYRHSTSTGALCRKLRNCGIHSSDPYTLGFQ